MAELSPTESQLIGSRIREARIKRRMSQAELADKAGISLPQISTIENGTLKHSKSQPIRSFVRTHRKQEEFIKASLTNYWLTAPQKNWKPY